MARRSNTQNTPATAEATGQEQVTEQPQGENTEPQAEATEPTASESNEGQSTEQAQPAPIDLTAFKEAVGTAVASRDESTGEVPLANIEPVNTAYRALDGIKPKNAAKSWLEDEMKAAILKLEAPLARAYSMVKDNLSAGAKGGGEKAPADPTAAFVSKVAAHRLALRLVEGSVPENVDGEKALAQVAEVLTGLDEQVEKYRAWSDSTAEDKGDAPEVSPVVRSAFKLAAGKASGGGRVSGSSGVRRDISKHIQSAFAEAEEGTFLTVAQIANHKSEEYGDEHPSQGAVSARLFPTSGKCTVPGVVPVDRDSEKNTPRGARKESGANEGGDQQAA